MKLFLSLQFCIEADCSFEFCAVDFTVVRLVAVDEVDIPPYCDTADVGASVASAFVFAAPGSTC